MIAAALLATSGLACAGDMPFAGRWDCDGSLISFARDGYDNGLEKRPITEIVSSPDGIYGVFVDEATFVTVSDVTDDSIRWTAGDDSGVSVTCSRVRTKSADRPTGLREDGRVDPPSR